MSASLITWLQHINFRDAACSWCPCAHTTRSACSLDASLLTWPAVCSRYPSTGFRSPAYLLKWHPVRLACGTHVPTLHEVHVRTSPASLLRHGLRPANGTHLPPLQQINVRDAACSRYPCAHTRRSACSLVAGLPAHMPCGLLTVPVYLLPTLRQSVVGFSAHMACGLLTAPVYRHYASAVVVLPVRILCALLTVIYRHACSVIGFFCDSFQITKCHVMSPVQIGATCNGNLMQLNLLKNYKIKRIIIKLGKFYYYTACHAVLTVV